MNIREERMSDAFTKFHIDGLPFPAVLHCFTAPDYGDPHDHPWSFRSVILQGGYVEEVYSVDNGYERTTSRCAGDSFFIPAGRIHRITRLLDGECWTLITPQGPSERKSGFYQFMDDGEVFHRFWDQRDWERL